MQAAYETVEGGLAALERFEWVIAIDASTLAEGNHTARDSWPERTRNPIAPGLCHLCGRRRGGASVLGLSGESSCSLALVCWWRSSSSSQLAGALTHRFSWKASLKRRMCKPSCSSMPFSSWKTRSKVDMTVSKRLHSNGGPASALAMRMFSDRALAIQPTGVRKMFDLAGDDVISFGFGEPDFQPPCWPSKPSTKPCWTDATSTRPPRVCQHCARKLLSHGRTYQSGMNEDNVCMTMSGTNALLNLFLTVVNPGDNILLPEPYFPLYGPDATLVGGEAKVLSLPV